MYRARIALAAAPVVALAVGLAACGNPAPTLLSIAVVPLTHTLPNGTSLQLRAVGVDTAGAARDVTAAADWKSSDEAIALVSNDAATKGLATAKGLGTATITVTFEGKQGTAALTVSDAVVAVSLAIDPPQANLQFGTTQALKAVATFSDNSTREVTGEAEWTSSAPAVATVDGASSRGLVTAAGAGSAVITATWNGLSRTAEIAVSSAPLESLELAPASATLPAGTSVAFKLTAKFKDGTHRELTTEPTWASDNTLVATVSGPPEPGVVRGVSAGLATVSATFGGQTATAAVTVSSATLTALALAPAEHSMAAGTTQPFAAFGTYTDGTVRNVTAQAAWASGDPSVALVSDDAATKGVATALATGSCQVRATLADKTAVSTLTVTDATLSAIDLTPPSPVVALGNTVQLKAMGAYSDGTARDVTALATWKTSASAVAEVSNAEGTRGLVTPLGAGSTTISATVGTTVSSVRVQVTAAFLRRIEIAPAAPTLPAGTSAPLTATGTYSDGTVQDLTGVVTWSSSDTGVLTVSNASGSRGRAAGVAPGTATVSAVLGNVGGAAAVTVSDAQLLAIALSPSDLSLVKRTHRRYRASGTYSDGTTLDVTDRALWASSNEAVLTVSNADGERGLVTGAGAGAAVLSATLSGVTGSLTLQVQDVALVSIAVAPAGAHVPRGTTLALTAVGTYSDGTTDDVTHQATWTVSNPALATVSNAAGHRGELFASTVGTVSVTATVGTVSGTQAVIVSAATLASVQVTATSLQVPLGLSQPCRATGVYSDGSRVDVTQQATWSSSAPLVLAVSNTAPDRGLASALQAGGAEISASFGGVSGTLALTAVDAVLVSLGVTPAQLDIAQGMLGQAEARGLFSDGTTRDMTTVASWSVSDTDVATVSNGTGTRGLVTGVAPGTATLVAAAGGKQANATVVVGGTVLSHLYVAPLDLSLPRGASAPLTATGVFSDGTRQTLTRQATWTSDDTGVATVGDAGSAKGVVTGVAGGTTTIAAALSGHRAVGNVTVANAAVLSLAITPATVTLPRATPQRFTAIATLTDGSTEDVTAFATWSSDAPATVAVTEPGWAVGAAAGTGHVIAAVGARSQLATFTVTAAQPVSLAITPASANVARGLTTPFTARATYDNGATLDVTARVVWSTGSALATISNAAADAGTATGVDRGDTTVTATMGALSATAALRVGEPVVVALRVTPATPTIDRGTTQAFVATATYSDRHTEDASAAASWTSSDAAIAEIAAGGVATGRAAGTTTVTASFSGFSASTLLTVVTEHLVSVEVRPAAATVDELWTRPLTAHANWSNGTTTEVTAQSAWTTSDATVATVDDGEQKGLVRTLKPGTATITAAYSGKSGTSAITVTAPRLVSVEVATATASVPAGRQATFSATAHWSNETTTTITASATWATSDANICTVAADGTATGLRVGTCRVQATYQGTSGDAALVVTAPVLVGLAVAPETASVAAGRSRSLAATASWSDSTTTDATTDAAWTTSDAATATVSAGLVTGVRPGSATITATLGDKSDTAAVTVTSAVLASLAIVPDGGTVQLKGARTFAVVATLSDGATEDATQSVAWTVSDKAIASVSGGLVRGLAAGSVTLFAARDGVTDTASVQVLPIQTLTVAPATATLDLDDTRAFTATAGYEDGSTLDVTQSASWQSSAATVASVSSAGVATALAGGEATITASVGEVSGTATLTVRTLADITLTPEFATLDIAGTRQLSALGTFSDEATRDIGTKVTWTSSDPAIATVSASGLVTAISGGLVTITATWQGVSATAEITVRTLDELTAEPGSATLEAGATQAFSVVAWFSDGSSESVTTATWTSSAPAVATVSGGVVTGVARGTANITATWRTASVTVPVTVRRTPQSVSMEPASATLDVGGSRAFALVAHYADGSTEDLSALATWSSSDEDVVTVAAGLATAVAGGTATVTAEWDTFSADAAIVVRVLQSLAVEPATATIEASATRALVATGTYSDGSTEDLTARVTWTSSDPAVASVSAGGVVTGLTGGAVTITATRQGVSETADITVRAVDELVAEPASATLEVGATQALTVVAWFTDGSTEDVTGAASWTSSSAAATVSAGVVTGAARGSANITASWRGASVTVAVTVQRTPQSVSMAPASATLAPGATRALALVAHHADGSTEDLSALATWTSSDEEVATVSSAGLVTAVGGGTATVDAEWDSFSASASITVRALESISVEPATATLEIGASQALVAVGTFSDGSTEDVTARVAWTAAPGGLATLSGSTVLGIAGGTVTVTATLSGLSGSAEIAVLSVTGITVLPPAATVAVGATQAFTATASWSDDSVSDVTARALWTSGSEAIATVSSTGAARGTATGVAAGSTSITATLGGVSGSAALSVE